MRTLGAILLGASGLILGAAFLKTTYLMLFHRIDISLPKKDEEE